MPFQKGNTIGNRFTNNQPSPAAKRRGHAEKKLMRDTMKELLESIEPDDKAAQAVMALFPKKKRNKVTTQDVICLRQILEAKKGNSNAYQNIIKTIGESTEKVELGMKDGALLNGIQVEIIDRREQVRTDTNANDA